MNGIIAVNCAPTPTPELLVNESSNNEVTTEETHNSLNNQISGGSNAVEFPNLVDENEAHISDGVLPYSNSGGTDTGLTDSTNVNQNQQQVGGINSDDTQLNTNEFVNYINSADTELENQASEGTEQANPNLIPSSSNVEEVTDMGEGNGASNVIQPSNSDTDTDNVNEEVNGISSDDTQLNTNINSEDTGLEKQASEGSGSATEEEKSTVFTNLNSGKGRISLQVEKSPSDSKTLFLIGYVLCSRVLM